MVRISVTPLVVELATHYQIEETDLGSNCNNVQSQFILSKSLSLFYYQNFVLCEIETGRAERKYNDIPPMDLLIHY